MHDVAALLLEVDPFLPDAADQEHERVVEVVEVASVRLPSRLFVGLAHQRLGHREEAEHWQKKADKAGTWYT